MFWFLIFVCNCVRNDPGHQWRKAAGIITEHVQLPWSYMQQNKEPERNSRGYRTPNICKHANKRVFRRIWRLTWKTFTWKPISYYPSQRFVFSSASSHTHTYIYIRKGSEERTPTIYKTNKKKKKKKKKWELPLRNPPHREGFHLWTKAYVSISVQEKPGQ